MVVLYNGEYTDFDITADPQWKNKLKNQQKFYPQWEGKVFGCFEVVKVEWDWGLSVQRALLKCVHCGFEKYTNSPRAFRRGEGTSQKCDCRRPVKIEKSKKEILRYADYVGEEKGGFVCVEYTPNKSKGMLVRCIKCGKEKRVRGKYFLDETIVCNHATRTKYGEELIGKQFGDLTVLEKRDGVFLCRCECGFEKEVPAYRFVNGYTRTCGRPECNFHQARQGATDGEKRRRAGLAYEHNLQTVFEQLGCEVERTPDCHDYGVDFVAIINGERWAFQCKKMTKPSSVHAVLEAYAGGRFYDCTRFCVFSPSGFTTNAIRCAAKLGVQLESDRFRFNLSRDDNTRELLDTASHHPLPRKEDLWTIDGTTKPIDVWCKEYNVSQRQVKYRMSVGMGFKDALTYKRGIKIEINGETKTKKEWCEEFGISTALFNYRVEHCKMTPHEALTAQRKRKSVG